MNWTSHRGPIVIVASSATVLVLGGLWIGLASGERVDAPAEKRFSVKVERAKTGQKIKLDDDQEVIYAGIRVPYANEPLYAEATARNGELVDGKRIRLRFDEQEHDRKGRLHAYAFVKDEMVNEPLVREGLAWVRLTPDTRRFAEPLLAAQKEARAKKQGVWRLASRGSEASYPADPKYGNFHTPKCEVVANIKPERRIDFKTKSQAYDNGYAPCAKCNP